MTFDFLALHKQEFCFIQTAKLIEGCTLYNALCLHLMDSDRTHVSPDVKELRTQWGSGRRQLSGTQNSGLDTQAGQVGESIHELGR